MPQVGQEARKKRLFVYGTLQPHAGTRMGGWIAERLLEARPASVPGRLHAVRGGNGWFPALTAAKGDSLVRGTLCTLSLEPGALARLDRYEGLEYRRVCLPVSVGGRKAGHAQVYLWRIALPSDSLGIPRGDFLSWLRKTGRKSFSTPRNGN